METFDAMKFWIRPPPLSDYGLFDTKWLLMSTYEQMLQDFRKEEWMPEMLSKLIVTPLSPISSVSVLFLGVVKLNMFNPDKKWKLGPL